jgi:hypothetical protein
LVWDVWPLTWHYEADWSGEWDYSEIYMDTGTASDDIRNKGTWWQKGTFLHEVGHAIALKDVSGTAHLNINALLKGTTSSYNTPQQHDIDNLKAKWD